MKHLPGVTRGITRDDILEAAVRVASRRGGWTMMTRQCIAQAADCSEGLVSHKLGDMKTIRMMVYSRLSKTLKKKALLSIL